MITSLFFFICQGYVSISYHICSLRNRQVVSFNHSFGPVNFEKLIELHITSLTYANKEICANINTIKYDGVKNWGRISWACTFSKYCRWYLCIWELFIELLLKISQLHFLISQWIFLLGRNGKLCITVSKQSRLEISFSSKPQEFNPYCLIPSKTSSQTSSHSIASWCPTENNQICIKYTLRYGSNKLIHFATVKENGKVICGSESTRPTTSKMLSKVTPTISTSKNICTAKYNYKEVLHKSLLFYEAQRSGHLPKSNRILWRKNSMLNDGSSVGYDLTGGYFDAGDYVKFSFPMASAMTLLAWGMVEFSDGYKFAGEYQNGLNALKWGADYLIKCHTGMVKPCLKTGI